MKYNVFQGKLIMHVSINNNNTIHSTMSTRFIHIADLLIGQEMLWEETLADDPETELDARGGLTQANLNQKLHHDIQMSLS